MDHTLPITQRILSPTDLSQFLRLERCERFLRLRMYERENGRKFLFDFDVAPQELPPILGRTGEDFEQAIVAQVAKGFPFTDYAQTPVSSAKGHRLPDNDRFIELARGLKPGGQLLVAQPRLELPLGQFLIRGDADLVFLERHAEGALEAIIVDIKSSTAVKVEHRLQVAFYAKLIEKLLPEIATETAILYKGPALGGTAQWEDKLHRDRASLKGIFGCELGFLERIVEADAYAAEVDALVSGGNPVAERVATKDAGELVFALGIKCDGCLFNQYCMKKAHLDSDLALLPYLTVREKKALRRSGVHNLPMLAELKEVGADKELVATPGAEATLKALAGTIIGPRVDELILRARRKVNLPTLPYIPNKGHGTLPASSPEQHPNLVRLFIELQHDFVQDRVWQLAALVVANVAGIPTRRKHIVHSASTPPETPEQESALFARWIEETILTIAELAEGDEVPIHLIFWNDYGQKTLLEALARNLPPMVAAAPALYDFVTQIAAFDSPVATFLAEEIRQHKNYSPVCPSLPLLAVHTGFDWGEFKKVFRENLFDNRGVLEDGTHYARRSRHSSQVPLEYAYAAWDELPAPPTRGDDPYRAYRGVSQEQLNAFARKRLDAIEHLTGEFAGNDKTYKTPFRLPDLSQYQNRAQHLAEAIREFLTIERHTYMAGWRTVRQMAPERRALLGETLLVSYHDCDQDDGGAHMAECRARHALHEAWKEANPGKRRGKAEMETQRWSLADETIILRIETTGTDTDLEQLLGLLTIKEGDRLICYPRLTSYGQPAPYTPTPKQLLYGSRVDLKRIVVEEGSAKVWVTSAGSMSSQEGYVFRYDEAPFEDGTLYTFDEDPNDFLGARMKKLADALCQRESDGIPEVHGFYHRLSRQDLTSATDWPEAAQQGQERFLAGLEALHTAGIAYAFEPSKTAYIGQHGGDPLLLVQGPPGTGKSFSTGFAVLARLQGALAAGIRQRVGLSCKTHSATDVLLKGVTEAQETLGRWQLQAPELFTQFFDARLLEIPHLRLGKAYEGETAPDDPYLVLAGTPASLAKLAPSKDPFGTDTLDLVVLDEASQMSLPESLLATLPLTRGGRVVVVGDPRQMPPIVQHAWENEARRTFQVFPTYLSLFDFLLALKPPLIQFEESFRLHQSMAEFLREAIYQHDGIAYHSHKLATLEPLPSENPLVAAALSPDYPLIVLVHDEADSQTRNAFEEQLLGPILRALSDQHQLDPRNGFGVVVPHRAQRAALRIAHPQLCILDDNRQVVLAAVDTVERYQGDEREVVIISATESDPDYIQASAGFLLDPRRLTVALSRAKKKMILIASRSIFEYASTDEEMFRNAQIWKNLLRRTCHDELYHGEQDGKTVTVYGCPITKEPTA